MAVEDASGEPDWSALYRRHRDAMYRVVHSVLRGSGMGDHAEDMVNDAMESLMRRPPENVTSWEALLVTAAKRKALDLVRSAAVRHGAVWTEPAAATVDRTQLGTDELAVDRVAALEAGGRLWDSMAVLDGRSRQVLWRVKALEHSRVEVARDFGITPARVSQICTEALKKLEQALTEEGECSGD